MSIGWMLLGTALIGTLWLLWSFVVRRFAHYVNVRCGCCGLEFEASPEEADNYVCESCEEIFADVYPT